jgi:hypothetical protein
MKRLVLLLGCSGALLCGADLVEVRSVYVMPMAKGLDQYLANRIAGQHVFRVVTDPKLADAVLTDLIGDAVQKQLENISPAQKPVEPAADEPETKTPAKAEKADKPADAAAKPAAPAAPAAKPSDPAAKPAEPAVAKAAPSVTVEKVAKPAKKGVENPDSMLSMFQDTENQVARPVSSFSRAKGTIFLVDAKSRQIVWSTYDLSKGTRSNDLDRTASDIVGRLKKDLKPKKQQ